MKLNKEFSEAAERTMSVFNTAFSRREFLRFALETYQSLPLKEFGSYFDDVFIPKMVKENKLKIIAPLIYDTETYVKTSLVPAAAKDEIEVLTATDNLKKNVTSKY